MGSMFKTEAVKRRDGTFQVMLYLCPGSDEMIETLTHAACFRTEKAAKLLAAKIQNARTFDAANWFWSPSVCSPYAFMHEAPKANLYPVDR